MRTKDCLSIAIFIFALVTVVWARIHHESFDVLRSKRADVVYAISAVDASFSEGIVFTTIVVTEVGYIGNFGILPPAVIELMDRNNITAMAISFRQGMPLLVNYLTLLTRAGVLEFSGLNISDPVDAPVGAALYFASDAPIYAASVLREASGLLGGSFSTPILTHAFAPPAFAWPRGVAAVRQSVPLSPHRVGYHFPRESVCTETFAPWMALLPCAARAGVAALLRPQALCEAPFAAVGLSVTMDHRTRAVALQMWAAAVFERGGSDHDGSDDADEWQQRFASLRVCPSADVTTLRVTDEQTHKVHERTVGDAVSTREALSAPVSPLSVRRSVRDGFVRLRVRNDGQQSVRVSVFDPLPWYVRLYASQATAAVVPTQKSVVVRVVPARDRGDAGSVTVEDALLRPLESLEISVRYEVGFLHLAEHIPDPNRCAFAFVFFVCCMFCCV